MTNLPRTVTVVHGRFQVCSGATRVWPGNEVVQVGNEFPCVLHDSGDPYGRAKGAKRVVAVT